jgi:hypothetical protein
MVCWFFFTSATASLSFDELFFLSISTLRPSLPMTPVCQVFSSGVTALKRANMQISGFCKLGLLSCPALACDNYSRNYSHSRSPDGSKARSIRIIKG